MKITNLLMGAISCLTIAATPYKASRECINSLSNNDGFGFDVAVNNKYLAVTELHENRVAIYTRNNSGQWIRSKEIKPPKDSIHGKIDKSFGRGLQLNGDVLAINAISYGTLPGQTSSKASYGRYMVRLDSETEVKEIDLPVEKKKDSILFNILEEGEIKQITIPNNGEKGFAVHNGINYNFAFNNKLLEIETAGYPSDNVSRPIPMNSGQPSQDLVLSPGDDSIGTVANIADTRRFVYTTNVDTVRGQSGSGIWHKLEVDENPRIMGVHSVSPTSFPQPPDIFPKFQYG